MARRSKAAEARIDKKRSEMESELQKYQKTVRDLRSSSESKLTITGKQKLYHKKILDLKSKLEQLGS